MPHTTHTIRLFNEHIYVIGDLHLGDGTRSDVFFFGRLCHKTGSNAWTDQKVRENDGVLIINGDCMIYNKDGPLIE